jgi:MFS family permease
MSFVPMTLSATADVPAHEAGLAAGLINTTRQVGGALGLAIMATVASTIASHRVLAHHSADSALTSGYRAAFVIAGCAALIGALLASLLPRHTTPIPAAIAADAEDLAIAD